MQKDQIEEEVFKQVELYVSKSHRIPLSKSVFSLVGLEVHEDPTAVSESGN